MHYSLTSLSLFLSETELKRGKLALENWSHHFMKLLPSCNSSVSVLWWVIGWQEKGDSCNYPLRQIFFTFSTHVKSVFLLVFARMIPICYQLRVSVCNPFCSGRQSREWLTQFTLFLFSFSVDTTHIWPWSSTGVVHWGCLLVFLSSEQLRAQIDAKWWVNIRV